MSPVATPALQYFAVSQRRPADDARAQGLRETLRREFELAIDDLQIRDLYTVAAKLNDEQLPAAAAIFGNPVIEAVAVNQAPTGEFDWIIEVGFRPGVTDNIGRTARGALTDLLGTAVDGVYTSRQYLLRGNLRREALERAANETLHNGLIQRCAVKQQGESMTTASLFTGAPTAGSTHQPVVEEIDLKIDDEALLALNRQRTLALSLAELKTIRDYYGRPAVQQVRATLGLPATATDVELEALAQTWSEHCKHKIFNATIEYNDGKKKSTIRSLFKTFIRRSTEKIAKRRDWLVSVFTDNAGIIKFIDDWNLVMKVETHNSPSALDPYGGALTGILGVNRDTLGTGKAAALIFNTDIFCFASPFHDSPLPPRLLHPRRIAENVRRGVEHGGNKTGIPTVNGSVVYDQRFLGKPLVFCGTGGLIPATVADRPSEEKEIKPGDLAVMVGGRIGKDGIHGATFSSEELHQDSPVSAVQIGDPITQKNLSDFLLEARDQGLFKTLTDNGAGGLSSSIGEMAELSGGCEIQLEQAPLKYPGLDPWEILISESQERMTLAVAPERWREFAALAERRGVEASAVGTFTDSGYFHVLHDGQTVGYLELEFLHHGLPEMKLTASWQPPELPESKLPEPKDYAAELAKLLGRLNICSKESVVRQYDHEVQGSSVVKPLTGAANDGPSDAGVVRPRLDQAAGVVVSHGICPRYSDLDTYQMAANAIDEAVRNAVATGADPAHLAGLDNFCWPDPIASQQNPDGEYKLAQLVRANQALYDYTVAFGVPCISGKDSMKNDYTGGDIKISIPPTLLFTVVGKIADSAKAVTMDVKRAGDLVYLLGLTKPELGGSEYLAEHGEIGARVPQVDAKAAVARYEKIHTAMQDGLIASAHDCSDGGLAVALAESAFAGGLGMEIDLGKLPVEGLQRDDEALFSESASRLVVTVQPKHRARFEKAMAGDDFATIGTVRDDTAFVVSGLGGLEIINSDIAKLKTAWQAPLGV